MGLRIIQFVFFANYFVGLLAVALSVETVFQLELPLNSWPYYILLFSVTVMYYTYAYSGSVNAATSSNPRTEWYRQHYRFVQTNQKLLLTICILTSIILIGNNYRNILSLPLINWLMVAIIPIAAILYYGLLPKSLYKFNLRNTGWLKAFVIGFVWAGCVNILPVTMIRIEYGVSVAESSFMLWLFIKNWMFCTVNAIMFDIKDYDDDANRQLKTFVVRMGLENYLLCADSFVNYRIHFTAYIYTLQEPWSCNNSVQSYSIRRASAGSILSAKTKKDFILPDCY